MPQEALNESNTKGNHRVYSLLLKLNQIFPDLHTDEVDSYTVHEGRLELRRMRLFIVIVTSFRVNNWEVLWHAIKPNVEPSWLIPH